MQLPSIILVTNKRDLCAFHVNFSAVTYAATNTLVFI